MSPLFYKVIVVMELWVGRGNMAECKKCGLKLSFRNNFGGVCEECYDKRLREKKELNNVVVYE